MENASEYSKNFAAGLIAGLVMFGPALCVVLWEAFK